MTNINVIIGNTPVAVQIANRPINSIINGSVRVSSANDKVKADLTDPTADYLDGKVDNSTLAVDATAHKIEVKDLGIDTGQLAADAVTTDKVDVLDYVDFNTAASPSELKGRVSFIDGTIDALQVDMGPGRPKLQIGQEDWFPVYNPSTTTAIPDGEPVAYAGTDGSNRPLAVPIRADNTNLTLRRSYIGLATEEIAPETWGKVSWRGDVNDIDTSGLAAGIVYLGTTTRYSNTPAQFPDEIIIIGAINVVDASVGQIAIKPTYINIDSEFDGCVTTRQDVSIVNDGGTLYFEVELIGGGDVRVQFGGDDHLLDCLTGSGTGGKARSDAITPGTATAIQVNYCWIEMSGLTPVLKASTAWPASPNAYARVAVANIWSVAKHATDGAAMFRRITDAIAHENRGRMSYLGERIRAMHADYWSGITTTLTEDTGPTPDSFVISTGSGEVYQLHIQDWNAYDISTDGLWVSNASGIGTLTNFQKVLNLNELEEDALGNTASNNDRGVFVLWGDICKVTNECKMYVTLPRQFYTTDTGAYYDTNGYGDTNIPQDFRGTGFLIAKWPAKYSGGNWESVGGILGLDKLIDLRGTTPGQASSGGGGGGSGTGDVVGPASAVDERIALFDGATGKLIKDGGQGLPSGTILGTTDTQTQTNKTFDDEVTVQEIATPSTPATGYQAIYPKADGSWYTIDDAGVETQLGAGASPLTTKGDLYGFSTVDARLPVGADGETVLADSSEALGVKWGTPVGERTNVVASGTVSTATDTIDITVPAGKNYILKLVQFNTFGATSTPELFVNDATGNIDDTSTNYYSQRLRGTGTSALADLANNAKIGVVTAGEQSVMTVNIDLGPDRVQMTSEYNRFAASSNVVIGGHAVHHNGSKPTNIVKLQLHDSDSEDTFGIGTYWYVIDPTIASGAPGPLMSDIEEVVSTATTLTLTSALHKDKRVRVNSLAGAATLTLDDSAITTGDVINVKVDGDETETVTLTAEATGTIYYGGQSAISWVIPAGAQWSCIKTGTLTYEIIGDSRGGFRQTTEDAAGNVTIAAATTAAKGSLTLEATDVSTRYKLTTGTGDAKEYEIRAIAAGGANDYLQFRKINDAHSVFTDLFKIYNDGEVEVPIGPLTVANDVDITSSGELTFASNTVIDSDRLVNARSYTVATLPTPGTASRKAYASDGRKNGEGAASGTGVAVFDDGTNWIANDSGQTVAA